MKAVILAAGEGTRLRPFTMSRPKGMIPVGNRPILDYIVEALVQNGIKDIIMVVGYRKDTILSHFEDGRRFGARIMYVAQDKQLGTAHALSLAARHLTGEDFLTVAGDNLIDAQLVADLLAKRKGPSMVVTDEPSQATAKVMQERCGAPSTSTVHAPHTPCSHDRWVPVSPSSRRTKSPRCIRGSTRAVTGSPLTTSEIGRVVMCGVPWTARWRAPAPPHVDG